MGSRNSDPFACALLLQAANVATSLPSAIIRPTSVALGNMGWCDDAHTIGIV
jgi:hypothetical protein